MNYWKTLNIEPTDDKKAIKKAYAVLIKQYKPDENPEKFQEIQAAYKYALEIIRWDTQLNAEAEPRAIPVEIFHNKHLNNSTNISDENNEETRIINGILEKTEKLLQSELLERENKHYWKFLENSNKILDLKAREVFSQQLFALISKYNLAFYKYNKRVILSSNIMDYINSFADWGSQWQAYSYFFEPEELQAMYIAIEGEDKKLQIRPIDLSLRIRTLFSDLTISYFFAAYFYYFKDYTFTETLMLTFKIFIISGFFIELVFKQSIAKFNRKIFIADEFGNKCSIFKTFIRHLIITLTLTPLYVWSFDLSIDAKIWIGFFCIMIFLHLITILNKDKLFHDFVTNTIVLRKE